MYAERSAFADHAHSLNYSHVESGSPTESCALNWKSRCRNYLRNISSPWMTVVSAFALCLASVNGNIYSGNISLGKRQEWGLQPHLARYFDKSTGPSALCGS